MHANHVGDIMTYRLFGPGMPRNPPDGPGWYTEGERTNACIIKITDVPSEDALARLTMKYKWEEPAEKRTVAVPRIHRLSRDYEKVDTKRGYEAAQAYFRTVYGVRVTKLLDSYFDDKTPQPNNKIPEIAWADLVVWSKTKNALATKEELEKPVELSDFAVHR